MKSVVVDCYVEPRTFLTDIRVPEIPLTGDYVWLNRHGRCRVISREFVEHADDADSVCRVEIVVEAVSGY